MSPPATVCVVDDDPAVRDSVEALLEAEGFEVRLYATAPEFLATFRPENCACVLLDVRMPGMDGLTLLEVVSERWPNVSAVMMTGHGDIPMAVRAIRAGAADFVEKPFRPERLLDAIRLALSKSGRRVAEPGIEASAHFTALTPREAEVMEQMVIGKPNKLIADALDMSPRTVEIHRARVMQKTGARSLSHLVRMALKAGYDPDG